MEMKIIDKIKGFLWTKLGIRFESSAHHVCTKCQEIIFCPQTNIASKVLEPCKYGGNHEDWEVTCNCDRNKELDNKYCNSRHPKKNLYCIRAVGHAGMCSDEERHRGK